MSSQHAVRKHVDFFILCKVNVAWKIILSSVAVGGRNRKVAEAFAKNGGKRYPLLLIGAQI